MRVAELIPRYTNRDAGVSESGAQQTGWNKALDLEVIKIQEIEKP